MEAKRDKGYAWHTAIDLQAVDRLKTSEYLAHIAIRNIEGEISFEEANALLQTYYERTPAHDFLGRTEKADKVSARTAALLSECAFGFTSNEYLSIPFIGRCLPTSIPMPDVSEITTLQKRNGR